MKKTQWIELCHNIRHTWVSFVSIAMFVLLGIAVFMGMDWTGKDMTGTAEARFTTGNYSDYDILFPYGVNEAGLDEIRTLSCVSEAEGYYSTYQNLDLAGESHYAHIISITDQIDVFSEIEGTLPQKSDEICLDKNMAKSFGLQIGDTVTFTMKDAANDYMLACLAKDEIDALQNSLTAEESTVHHALQTGTFTITAIVENPRYFSVSASSYGTSLTDSMQADCVFYVDPSAFNPENLSGYSNVLVRCGELSALDSYSDTYRTKSQELQGEIEDCANRIAKNTAAHLSSNAAAFSDQIENTIASGKAEIAAGKFQSQMTGTNLVDGIEQVTAAKQSYETAAALFDEAKTLYQTTLNDFETWLASCQNEPDLQKIINNGIKFLEDILRSVDFIQRNDLAWGELPEDLLKEIDDFKIRSNQRLEKIIEGENVLQILSEQLNDTRRTFDPVVIWGQDELSTEETTITDTEAAILSGQQALSAAQAKLNQAEKTLSDLQSKYEKWHADSENIKDYGAITTAHTANSGYIFVKMLSDIVAKIKFSMGGLFLVISFFICYSAVTRMINLQQKEIGTKKALGFKKSEITVSTLLYTGMAALIGAVPGILLAHFVVEPLLVNAMCTTFTFKCTGQYFSVTEALLIMGLELAIILIITWFACFKILRKDPLTLLNGRKASNPKSRFYEKFGFWQKTSTLTKTIVNNLFNDWPRVIAMLIGITSCCVLIVSSVSMKENVLKSFEKQYAEYVHYDKIIYYDNAVDGTEAAIEKILEEHDVTYSRAYKTIAYVSNAQMPDNMVQLVVFRDDFDRVLQAESIDAEQPMSNKGTWLPESLQQYYHLSGGDQVNLKTLDGTSQAVSIDGYFHFYVYHLMALMDRETAQSVYENLPEDNVYLIRTEELASNEAGTSFEKLEEQLKTVGGYLQTYHDYQRNKKDAEVFTMIANVFVGLYLFVSFLMAFFVLLNLLLVFVEEKKAELIVTMINGYSKKAAYRYIWQDVLILGIVGILFGVLLGFIAGDWNCTSFESNYLYLCHDLSLKAALVGALVTGVLTAMMTLIALRKIGRFKLSDINRT